MSQYTDFSYVYDLFMDNIPYEEWADGIDHILKKNGIENGLVLDLGCGTGTLTELMAQKGYDMIGIDSSEDMLSEARDKQYERMEEAYAEADIADNTSDFSESDETVNEPEILYLCQDISNFELYGTVRAVISTCDTFNYLTDENAFLKALKLINNYIEPDGVLIFDMNAPEKYESTLADNVFAENRDDASFIWENSYDKDSKINEYALTLFIRDDETSQYEKSEEFHYQRAYSREEIRNILEAAGFYIVDSFEKDMRMFYVAKLIEGRKIGNLG